MNDIVERLRRGVDTNNPPDATDEVMAQAADEIERLRTVHREHMANAEAEIEQLRLTLETERLKTVFRTGSTGGGSSAG